MQIEKDQPNLLQKIALKFQSQKPIEFSIDKNISFVAFQKLVEKELRIPTSKQKIIYQGKCLTSEKYSIQNLNQLAFKPNTTAIFQVMGPQEHTEIEIEHEEQKVNLMDLEKTKNVFLEDLINSGLKTYYFDKQIQGLSVMKIEVTNQFEELFENFQHLKNIEKLQLDFSEESLTEEQLVFFFEKITNIADLEYFTLDFGKCDLQKEGLKQFEKTIQKLQYLETLNINLEQTHIDDNTLISLTTGIIKLSDTISCLDLCLDYNQISLTGVNFLMDNIQKLPFLISLQLSLSNNNFHWRSGATIISNAIYKLPLLTNLDVDFGHFDPPILEAHKLNAKKKLSLMYSLLGSKKVLSKHKFLRVSSIIRQFLDD